MGNSCWHCHSRIRSRRGGFVVAAFDLAEHEGGLLGGEVGVLSEAGQDLFVRHEVAGDHGEDEPAVVTDVLAGGEGVEQVGHHGVFAEFGFGVRGLVAPGAGPRVEF